MPDSVNGQILNYFELSSSLHSFLLSSAVPLGKIGENKKQMSGFRNQLVAWQWCVNWTVPKQNSERKKEKSWVVKLGRRVSAEAVCMLKSLVIGQHRFSLRINHKCHYLYRNKYAWMCGGWIGIQGWGEGRLEGGGSGKKWINSFWMMRWEKYGALTRVMFTERHSKRNICIQVFGQNGQGEIEIKESKVF